MAQVNIPTNVVEIYEVTVQTGRYAWEESEPIPCEFDDHVGYPKYYTTYDEAKKEYDAIALTQTDEYPQRKSITTISLADGETIEEVENY